MLGKRKRDTQVVSRRKVHVEDRESTKAPVTNTNNVFRQYFEAQFEPLPEPQESDSADEDEDVSDDGNIVSDVDSDTSEWSGISETRNTEPVAVVEVKVIDHTSKPLDEEDEFHRARQKAFMSTKPPREIDFDSISKPTSTGTTKEETLTEQLNLKHDLDLQRLLNESHLLSRSKTSSAPGKERQRALDMRLQSLGAKESLFSQRKMPVAHRVGITRKADMKETRRRQEAKENGVVLEKVGLGKKGTGSGNGNGNGNGKAKMRERGVDAPGVGRFSGGTLKLSRRDVASIQGPPARSGGAGRKKGRR